MWVLGVPVEFVSRIKTVRDLGVKVVRDPHVGKAGVPKGDARFPDGSVLRAVPLDGPRGSKSSELRVFGRKDEIDRVTDGWDDGVTEIYEQEALALAQAPGTEMEIEEARKVLACKLLIGEGLGYKEVCDLAWPAGDGKVMWVGDFPVYDGMSEAPKTPDGKPARVIITRGSLPCAKVRELKS